jgi:hypothetical protein
MTAIPPLPVQNVPEFANNVQTPTWRQFWLQLLLFMGELPNGPALAASPSYANDAAAAAGGVKVGGYYRNGSVVQVRVI